MRKKISLMLIIIISLVVFSGCSSKNNATSNKKVKILFTVSDASDSYRKMLADGAKSYAESKGIEIDVKDAAGVIETQVSQVKEAVAGGYNVIICAPVDPTTALELERIAKGVPIVFMNSEPDGKLLEKNKYIYVSSNEEVAGQYEAEYVLKYLNNKKDLKVVLLKGEKGHRATKGRTDAVKQTFADKGINAEYVFEDNANWSREKAKEMIKVFLTTGKKFDCIIANNDNMALGAMDALRESNIDPSTVPILGVDATIDACKAIKDGSIQLSVYQSAKGQSISAVEAAIKLGSGNDLSRIENITKDGKYIWIPFEKVDKTNVDKYMN